MGERYLTKSASMVYLLREHNGKIEVLLQQRGEGTYGTGQWDSSAAGHVDEDESMIMCALRETREEIGVDFNSQDIQFIVIQHMKPDDWLSSNDNNPYYNGHFFISKFTGTPRVCESDKCTELKWFNINDLPAPMFADRERAINNYLNKITYDEFGWE